MKLLLVGSVSYLGLAVLAWFIGGVWIGDMGKTEIVYVPEPHVVQEVVHDRVEVPVYITVPAEPTPTPIPKPEDTKVAVSQTLVPIPIVTPWALVATIQPTVVPTVPCIHAGKAVGWRRKHC